MKPITCVHAAIVFSVMLSSASAQLGIEVNPSTFEASIINTSDSVFGFDAYVITSPMGLLDPNGWISLEDQGVIGFTEAGNVSTESFAELYPTLPLFFLSPGESVGIGFPFGNDGAAIPALGGDAEFIFHNTFAPLTTTGPIFVAVPEPAAATLLALCCAPLAIARRHSVWRSMGQVSYQRTR